MTFRRCAQLMTLAFTLTSGGVLAQAGKEPSIRRCLLAPLGKLESVTGKLGLVGIKCGETSALLGPADRYELRVSPKDDHAIAVKYENDDVSIYRIDLARDGSPVVSDMTDIAIAALPAGYRKNFFNVSIDMSNFPKDGTVRVLARPKGNGAFGSRQIAVTGGRPKALEATVEL